MKLSADFYWDAKDAAEKRAAVLKLMEDGWILCLWRNSTPHNWFLENPQTKKDIPVDRNYVDPCWVRKLRDSSDRVIQYWGSDSRMPVLTKYVLRRRPYKIKLSRAQGGGFILRTGWFQSERITK